MKRSMSIAAACGLLILVAACGDEPPTNSFESNLDAACNPQDPVDKLMSLISAKRFWLEAEHSLKARLDAADTNIKNSSDFLAQNRGGIGAYRTLLRQRARELGYSGAETKRMIAENMAEFEQQAIAYKKNIEQQKIERRWARKCHKAVQTRLKTMDITAEDRARHQPSSTKKLKIAYEDLLTIKNLTVEQAHQLIRESTVTRQDMARALREQRVPADIRDDIMRGFEKRR